MTAQVWSNVGVAIESAKATAVTITGITKANPAVVTYTGTDPSNGDYVLLSVLGMYQLDARMVKIGNVDGSGNTFEITGVDSTAYDTFTSGTAAVLTLGTSLAVATDINVSGGEVSQIDITTIHDNVNKQIPGNASPISVTMNALWDPGDTGLAALKTASDSKALKGIKFTFSNGAVWCFVGYVGCTLSPTGAAQQAVKTPITISAYGKSSAYAAP